LDLPIDKNLGFAWIVPYGSRAQFQLGYKGFVQLALRTGQYKNINVIEVKEGQLKAFNPLTEELELDFNEKESEKVIGYAAYFKLSNGFEKTVYWSIEKVKAHAKRFSKTFNNGPWKTDFDEMAKKTVLKNTLRRWGILSIEMQTAFKTDQAAINDFKNPQNPSVDYVDSPDYEINDAHFEEHKNESEEAEGPKMLEGTPFEVKES
jgi:recombination protein RecT